MKTLIFNGSPRINGDTVSLIDILPLVISHNTNLIPAIQDKQALSEVKGVTEFFNNAPIIS